MNAAVVELREQLWIAAGCFKRWQVCSNQRSFGEFDELEDAREFRRLLVLGNPRLEVMS